MVGVWIRNTGSETLVHPLPVHQFSLVQDNRNRNKPTVEEKDWPQDSTVEIAGPSVGSSSGLRTWTRWT